MSMQTNIQYGYGIIASEIKLTDVERLKTLIHWMPDYEEEVNAYFKEKNIDNPSLEDYFEYMEDDEGIAGFLENLIYFKEGVDVYSCSDDDGKYYLLYPEGYPWNMNRLDLSLNEEKLKTLFQKYVALLSDEPVNIDYQRCERCS